MSSDGSGRIHRCDNHDPLKGHVIEVHVIESFIADDLLKEGDQLNGIVFVWARQGDVLEINDEPLALFGSEYTSLRSARLSAHLIELLNDILRCGLSIAIDDRNLCGFHLLDQIRNDQILTATLWADQDETLIVLKQRPY